MVIESLAPLLIGLAALVAVLSYTYRFRGMSRDERLAELRTVARGGERAAQAWVEAEIKRGTGWKRWVALVLVGLSGGVLASPEGRAVVTDLTVRMAAYAAAAGPQEPETDDERFRRPEWFETRVIRGVPASRYLDELDRNMRKRILSYLQVDGLLDVGASVLHGDSIGIDFQLKADESWHTAKVAFDWDRWQDDGYRDETAKRVVDVLEEGLR